MENQDSLPVPQDQPKLLQLPRELRDMIYIAHFSQVQVGLCRHRTGCGPTYATHAELITTNPLEILRSCRQIHEEARDLWISRVVFICGNIYTLQHALDPLPRSIRLRIRHLVVYTNAWELEELASPGPTVGNLRHYMETLSGLFLDLLWFIPNVPFRHLTAGKQRSDRARQTYLAIEHLVLLGGGWRSLEIRCDPLALGFQTGNFFSKLLSRRVRCSRKPQPSTWNHMLLERDGAESGASVRVILVKKPPGNVSVESDTWNCIFFEQSNSSEADVRKAASRDAQLQALEYERRRGGRRSMMRIRVERGNSVHRNPWLAPGDGE